MRHLDLVTNSIIRLNIALAAGAQAPTYASEGAGAIDIRAHFKSPGDSVAVDQGCPQIIPTGLFFEIPKHWTLFVFSRGGQGIKNDVRLANCVGVIDSDYRGELMVKLTSDNFHEESYRVNHGDRIAQASLMYTPRMVFTVKDLEELSKTERGANGFTSTGVK